MTTILRCFRYGKANWESFNRSCLFKRVYILFLWFFSFHLQLATRVAFHDHLLPVCLPPTDMKELVAGTNCTVIGWGKKEDKNCKCSVDVGEKKMFQPKQNFDTFSRKELFIPIDVKRWKREKRKRRQELQEPKSSFVSLHWQEFNFRLNSSTHFTPCSIGI